jgi:hypothetical protein
MEKLEFLPIRTPDTDGNGVQDKKRFQYVNPFSLLGIEALPNQPLDRTAIRQKSKRLLGEIELDESHAILFYEIRISKSDFHVILNELDDEKIAGFHLEISQNEFLVKYLHTSNHFFVPEVAIPSGELGRFIYPYLAFSFSRSLEKLCTHFDKQLWVKVIDLIQKIPSEFYDNIYEPISKRLRDSGDKVIEIRNRLSEKTFSNLDSIPDTVEKAIHDSLPIEAINSLPAYCSSFRSDLARNICVLSGTIYTQSSDSALTIRGFRIALGIIDDPMLQKQISDEIGSLGRLLANGPVEGNNLKSNVLKSLDELIQTLVGHKEEMINLERLNQQLYHVFSWEIISRIISENDEGISSQISAKIWTITEILGYSNSGKILEIFRPILTRNEPAELVYNSKLNALKNAPTRRLSTRQISISVNIPPKFIGFLIFIALIIIVFQVITEDSSNPVPAVSSQLNVSTKRVPKSANSSPAGGNEEYIRVGEYLCPKKNETFLIGLQPDTGLRSALEKEKGALEAQVLVIKQLDKRLKSLKKNGLRDPKSIEDYNALVETYDQKLYNYGYIKNKLTSAAEEYNNKVADMNSFLNQNCTIETR